MNNLSDNKTDYKIVILDDHKHLVSTIKMGLKYKGHNNVIGYDQSYKFIQDIDDDNNKLMIENINLIILDMNMPVVSGNDIIKFIYNNPNKYPKLIILSGYDKENIIEFIKKHITDDGINNFIDKIDIIQKPITIDKIIEIINN